MNTIDLILSRPELIILAVIGAWAIKMLIRVAIELLREEY